MGCCGGGSRNSRMPSLTQQVKNLVLSVANVLAYAAATGQIKAEPQIVGVRVDKCNKCRHLDGGTRCTICGCYIAMKAGLKAESCPLKLW